MDVPTPPRLVISIPLEGRPRVAEEAMTEGDSQRLHDWITASPRLRQLVKEAVVLMTEREAA